MKIKPYDFQHKAVESLWQYFEKNSGNPIVALPTGCHAKGSKILMFDGTLKNVEYVVIGDLLMGPDSLPRVVLQLARGKEKMYRVIPNKGEPFIVNEGHKLCLKITQQSKNAKFPCQQPKDEIVTVKNYAEGTKWYKHIRKLQRSPVNFCKKELPLEPYFIGLMLGDGSMCNGSFNYTSADGSGKFNSNPITKLFRELGIQEKRAWNKFVPHLYKTGDRDQLLQLLAGLLDSDGYFDSTGTGLSFCTVSHTLAKDVQFIARCLGFGAYIKDGKSFIGTKQYRDHYVVSFSGDYSIIPFKRQRHIDICKSRKKIKNVLVTGFKVEELTVDDFYGFLLDKDHLYLDENLVIHHNTGKSVCIAWFLYNAFLGYRNQKILIVTHRRKLIEQNYQKLLQLWESAPAGICSAGLGRKDFDYPIIFCGIATVYKHWERFKKVDLIMIDEAHLVSNKDDAMYSSFISNLLKVNPLLKVIGFTATYWRLGNGLLTDNGIFTDICFNMTDVKSFNWFITNGYLSPLIPKPSNIHIDVSRVRKIAGDYNQKDLQDAVDKSEITFSALKEMIIMAEDRKKWLIFSTGIEHTEHISEMLISEFGENSVAIHSGMPDDIVDKNIDDFVNGKYRIAVNNNILTTGFDCPSIDFLGILKHSMSSAYWVQMLGRGTRVAEGKENCLVGDFAGNTRRLGPINDPLIPMSRKKGGGGSRQAPIKICPKCNTFNHTTERFCISCNHEFEFDIKFGTTASTDELIRTEEIAEYATYFILRITYNIHVKPDRPNSLKVTYYCGKGYNIFSEYIGFEHGSMARSRAIKWWEERCSGPVPFTVNEAYGRIGELKRPSSLRVIINRKYPEIVDFTF